MIDLDKLENELNQVIMRQWESAGYRLARDEMFGLITELRSARSQITALEAANSKFMKREFRRAALDHERGLTGG